MNSPWFENLAIGLFVALIALSGVLQTLALRGRIRPAPPRCARCGQLTGAGEFERSGTCPECGADIRGEDSIRYFAYSLNGKLMLAGIVVLLLALATPFAFRFAMRSGRAGPSVSATTPFNELLANMRAGYVGNSTAVIEMVRRVSIGEVPAEDLDDMMEALVVGYEAKASMAWLSNEAQGLVSAAHAAKALTPDQLGRLGNVIFPQPTLRTRPAIREGAAIDPRLIGAESYGPLRRVLSIVRVEVDGVALPLEQRGSGAPVQRLDPLQTQGVIRANAAPGKHTLTTTYDIQYSVVPVNAPLVSTPSGPGNATTTLAVPREIEIVAKDAPPIVPATTDAALAAEMRRACKARAIAIEPSTMPGMSAVFADVEVEPVADWTLAFRVIAKIGDREVDLGTIHSDFHTKTMSPIETYTKALPDSATEATIIFRPDPLSVEDDPEVARIWGEEIVVERVPIVRGKAKP